MTAEPAPDHLALPALHASHGGIWLADAQGRTREVPKGEAVGRAAETPVLMLNAPLTGQRLGYPDISGLDLLELWAFVHPARFLVPTARGLAEALDLPLPRREADIPALYQRAAASLLALLSDPQWPEREGAWTAAQSLHRLRWPWGRLVASTIPKPAEAERWLFSKLPEWDESAPRPAPRPISLNDESVTQRLDQLTGSGAETRPGQRAYAQAAGATFMPRQHKDQPNMLLA